MKSRYGRGAKAPTASLLLGVVKLQQFLEHDRAAPAVHQDVMISPNELSLIFAGVKQRQAHQRRLRDFKSAQPIRRQKVVSRSSCSAGDSARQSSW